LHSGHHRLIGFGRIINRSGRLSKEKAAVIRLVVPVHGWSHFSDPVPVKTTAFYIC
jgi:hypothetical protein